MPARRACLALSLCTALALACESHPPPGSGDGGRESDGGSDAGTPPGSPGAPALSATSTPSPAAVNLRWTAADALATHFEILRAVNQGGFVQLAQVGGTASAYTDSAVSPGNSYAYQLTASDAAGTGAPSNEIDLLSAPSDVSAGGSDTRLIVTWGSIANADSYDVYRLPASGAALLLGNTASASFLDDGSVQAVTAGASYSYQVVAKSAGAYVASVGSNVATASALGLDVTADEIFVSDTGEETQSLAPVLVLQARNVDGGPLLGANGGPVVYDSLSNGAAMVVPGVPRGTYAITVLGYADYAVGSARAVDFSQAVMGRSSVQAAQSGTTLAYDLTGLTPWSGAAGSDAGTGDALEELSVGAGDYAANLADDVATPPDAGATVFAGTETLGSDIDTDSNLISADAGDALYLFQLQVKSSGNGVSYLAPGALYSSHSFSTADGASSSISGAMQAGAPIAIAALDFPRSAYLDPLHATQNPLASNPSQRVYLEVEKGFAAHGWYSNDSLADGLVVDIPQDGGTLESDGGVDLNAGAVSWANPVSSSWDSFVLVQSAYDVPVQISFEDTSTTPATMASGSTLFTSYSSTTVPMADFTFADSALTPTLSAPRAPQLNGASAFAAQSNLSPTSLLSWTAPALGTPGYYLVVIYSVAPEVNDDGTFVKDANGDYLLDTAEAASFTTQSTSVALAADLVPAGVSYFATIDAISNASAAGPIDGTVAPYTLGESYSSAETVTAIFTIAAPSAPAAERPLRRAQVKRPGRPGLLAKGAGPRRLPLPLR